MTALRRLSAAVIAVLIACSAPSPNIESSEIAALGTLKRAYPDVVMGFDIRPPTTLIVSLDLQHYIEMDDDAVAAMKRDVLARWRAVWHAAHPHAHALLHVRIIDFIGRKVAEESTKV
jgi:hypothetical protein